MIEHTWPIENRAHPDIAGPVSCTGTEQVLYSVGT